MKKTSRFVFVILLASLLLAACGGGSQTVNGSFVGKVDGSDAFIAVVLHGNGEVTAYICDGASISEWFKGNVDGSSLNLTNASGTRLTADLAADSFTGTFTPSSGSPSPSTFNKRMNLRACTAPKPPLTASLTSAVG